MAFKYNPVTGRFEVVPAGNSAGSQPPASAPKAPTVGPATAKQTVTNIGRAKQPVVNIGQAKPEQRRNFSASGPRPAAPTPPPRPVAGPPSPVTGQFPPMGAGNQPIVPSEPMGTMSSQESINAMYNQMMDEAAAYKAANFGADPPAGWWDSWQMRIKYAQDTLGSTGSGSGGGAAAAAQQELERIRNIKGGQAGEAFLREQAVTRKADMLKRVAELYDPQQTKSAEDLKTVLKQASDAYDLAEKQVGEAQANFQQQFRPSTAYEGIPIATYNVADNPLIAALQQQGAGTGQVDAATNYARQFAEQTSGLEKWAAGQLGTGQKNFEAAAQNAAQMGTMAALQGLSARRADVKTGIEQQFADALARIGESKTQAASDVDNTIADIIAKADELRADTLAKYGTLPAKKKAPAPVVKPAAVKPKTVVAPAKPTQPQKPNTKLNVR